MHYISALHQCDATVRYFSALHRSITVHCALLTVHCLVIKQLLTAINAFHDFLLHQSALNPVPFHCIPNSVNFLMVSPLVVIHVDSHTILQVLDLLPNHRLEMYKTPPKFPIQTHQLCTPMSLYALQMQKASYSRPFILQKHSAWAKTIAEQIAAKFSSYLFTILFILVIFTFIY